MALSEIHGATVSVKLWVPLNEIESDALRQLQNCASLPWVAHHVAAMPDVHLGHGATVGSVIAMRGAISPAAVGVDIGCGMAAVKTSLTTTRLPDSLIKVRLAIEAAIPTGFASHATSAVNALEGNLKKEALELLRRFGELNDGVDDLKNRAVLQLGTLGGGNHFIELCLDTENNVWLMLHSGSRNIGKTLAEIYMEHARWLTHNQNLPDRGLAAFLVGTPEMDCYRRDLYWAQEYARLNRLIMLERCQNVLKEFWSNITFETPVFCHHNYVAEETHFGEELFVTRKGAISARAGELGIIPGSMGAKSFIVRGLGNPESFQSASHGAGRKMSRSKARAKFTIEDLATQTAGVECRKDAGVLDEIPGAYKNIDRVMAYQADLVEIVATLKQVLCVKGGDEPKKKRQRERENRVKQDRKLERREKRARRDEF